MLNDLEFTYSPVREKVRDLREYLGLAPPEKRTRRH